MDILLTVSNLRCYLLFTVAVMERLGVNGLSTALAGFLLANGVYFVCTCQVLSTLLLEILSTLYNNDMDDGSFLLPY